MHNMDTKTFQITFAAAENAAKALEIFGLRNDGFVSDTVVRITFCDERNMLVCLDDEDLEPVSYVAV